LDSVRNPYSPGAGSPPSELAGRDLLREQLRVALARILTGKPAKSGLMVGLRGVGKTVLLDQVRLRRRIGPLNDAESPITFEDVEAASTTAMAALDESFFRVRFDRLTPTERTYLRAMSDLGPGPHRSGDIADRLRRAVSSLGPLRSSLIVKGMIWSPSHGDTAFTVPLFDEFTRRIMPGNDWET
jgi:AAA ATPase domain